MLAERSEFTVSRATGTKRKAAGSAASGQLSKKAPVKPCPICGTVVSRASASDVSRHMKIHGTDPTKKLPCLWDECKCSTLQKSNLNTHIHRHMKDKSYICTDNPASCEFQTCEPSAALLRHRKGLHDCIPGTSNSRKTPIPLCPLEKVRQTLPHPRPSSHVLQIPLHTTKNLKAFHWHSSSPAVNHHWM